MDATIKKISNKCSSFSQNPGVVKLTKMCGDMSQQGWITATGFSTDQEGK